MIYAAPDYSMGNGDAEYMAESKGASPAIAEPTADYEKAKRQIRRMRAKLKDWLKYRRINDDVAAGKRKAKIPQSMAAAQLSRERDYATEQQLADRLYHLLSQMMDASVLPDPNLAKDPNAAAKLAQIAIAGKLPGDSPAPEVLGIIWLWPVLIVGAVVFLLSQTISSLADVAKEKERLKCIRDGACTDTGFWLKVGAVAFVGWLLWDKMGLREKAKGALGGKQ